MRLVTPTELLGQHRLELAVVIILSLIFIVVATQRIWLLRVAAEQASVIKMVGNLRSAVGMQVMERALHHGLAAVAQMDRSNPIEYLDPRPAFYERLEQPLTPELMVPYRWYFDTTNGMLVYRVANGEYLETDLPGPPRIRLQLQLRYDDLNQNGHYDTAIDVVRGVDLIELDQYRWLTPG